MRKTKIRTGETRGNADVIWVFTQSRFRFALLDTAPANAESASVLHIMMRASADVVWARGAHFWKRQTRFNGFPISLERYVVARFGAIPSPLPIPALHATFLDAEVELGPATPA